MADKLKNYSTTAGSNNATPPNGWPEGMAPSAVNDSARAMMARLREWYQDAEWIDLGSTVLSVSGQDVTLSGDLTALYRDGQAVRIDGDEGTITAVALSVGNTVLTIDGFTPPASITTLEVGIVYGTVRRMVNGATVLEIATSGGALALTGNMTISGTLAVTGALTIGGNAPFTTANDGAGSGLDADLLDGQQGSYYTNASNLASGTVPSGRLSGTYGISISGDAATLGSYAHTAFGKLASAQTWAGAQTFGAGVFEKSVAMGANDIDLSLGTEFTKTISGNTTLTVSNVPAAGTAASFVLVLTNGGSATITWFSGVKWPGGSAPALTASGRDRIGFITNDGGTTWDAMLMGRGFA